MRRILLSIMVAALMIPPCTAKSKIVHYSELANTFQGCWNTEDFSHGRCIPYTALPHGFMSWTPCGFNYVKGEVSGIGSMGLKVMPFTSLEQAKVAAPVGLDREKSWGHPDMLNIVRTDGVSIKVVPAEHGGVMLLDWPHRSEAYLTLESGHGCSFMADTV
ncbi:MAG: hypothetical protein HUJ93_09310, partial [Bacteroidales bacterium]|nr:hypothetical protein [Bacteroidales bacterium]